MNTLINSDSIAFLKLLNERASSVLNGNNLLTMPIDEAREAFNKLVAPIPGKLKTIDVQVENKTIKIDDAEIPVRIYRPQAEAKNLPTLIYCHGGGFVFGGLDFLDYTCRALCEEAHCMVVAVGFRCAPEFKFPTAHMDCYKVARHIQKNAKDFGANGKLAVGGDSAGGNIAASLCHLAKEKQDLSICFQLLFYPWVDLNNTMPSDKTYAKGYFLETATIDWMREQYLSRPEEKTDPIANPQMQKDFSNLPPALIVGGECDPIHDDAKKYYQQLNKAGNKAQFIECGGILHDFCALPSHYEAALLVYSLSAFALRQAFNQ